MTYPALSQTEIALQTFALPERGMVNDKDIFLHRTDGVLLDTLKNCIVFDRGATVWFDTYFTVLNLGTWTRQAELNGLTLRLHGTGKFDLEIVHVTSQTSAYSLVETTIELSEAGEDFPVGPLLGAKADKAPLPAQDGLLTIRLRARHSGATFLGGGWVTCLPATARNVRLGISVTSFRREAETAQTARRISEFLDSQAGRLPAHVDLMIVDNGQTLDLSGHPRLTVIPNKNLGGAGGFARGLAEGRARDYTHVLFMDDDASFPMESLLRTIAFLCLARSPKAAVSGAMISAGNPTAMWENGAVFNRSCKPLYVGLDLRDAIAVRHMELTSARAKPKGFYAGWWYFAFPVAAVTRDPFPFFVRGDDISFSLANDFDTVTLSGVVSFQEDFSVKESPLTLYLDLRNHLHHHLVHPGLDIGAMGTAKIALRFIFRSIVRMHYDSAEAQLAAWSDVMKGPDFFASNADMAVRRPQITALARTEKWEPVSEFQPHIPDPHDPGYKKGRRWLMLANGHIVPFFGLRGRKVQIPSRFRGLIWPLWGAKEATFYDADCLKSYTVRHNKKRAFQIAVEAFGLLRQWRQNYSQLQTDHRAGYEALANAEFWQTQFDQESKAAAKQAAE